MKYSAEQIKRILPKTIHVNSIAFIGCGNHSEAFCVNNEIVIKLPKHNPVATPEEIHREMDRLFE